MDSNVKADAHWTLQMEKALLIKTADCIPVLMSCSSPKIALAVHAGWRGVANRIVIKSFVSLVSKGATPENFRLFTGPCIQYHSFEVRDDALKQILASVQTIPENSYSEISEGQYHVDLFAFLQQQLLEVGIKPFQVTRSHEDTLTNQQYFSYRRDNQNPGRQQSFIAIK